MKELVLWALRKRRRWRVRGTSMEPDFRHDDLVLINRTVAVKPGDAVVALHPFKKLDVIKYVQAVENDGFLTLVSPSGDDSRQFGRIPTRSVRGSVTLNLTARQQRRA